MVNYVKSYTVLQFCVIVQISPGDPPGKKGHIFCKNDKNNTQHHYTQHFIILWKVCKISKKHFLSNVTNFQPRGTWYVHLTLFVRCPRCVMISDKKAIENDWHIAQISPRGASGEIRIFSENCTLTSSIRGTKLKTQKTIFPIFPKTGSGTWMGSPRTHHQFWCICPVYITFCPFLQIVPGGHFDQFWPKWIFENFEKNEKC